MNSSPISPKIRANAVSSYLLLFISSLFFLNKDNKYLNNLFVKSHTKVALLIHIGFLITYIIFIAYGTGLNYQVLNYSINDIISISLFLLLFFFILIGIYKAHNGKTFIISKSFKTNKENNNILNIKKNSDIKEEDKVTIILSRIPFIGFIIGAKYKQNKIFQNTQKLNLIITFIIMFLYVYGNYNLASLLFLAYIIFIVFLGINLFINNKLIFLNLENIPSPKKLYLWSISFVKYMKNYFSQKKFKGFSDIFKEVDSENSKKENELNKKLLNKSEFRLKEHIIYIPIINIISIFDLNSKLKIHIINGLMISILLILSWLIFGFENKQQLFLLFPISFGIGNLNNLSYKLIIIYDMYNLINNIFVKFISIFSFLKKKHKEEKVFTAKVTNEKPKNNIIDSDKAGNELFDEKK